jgi:hypothetical protein
VPVAVGLVEREHQRAVALRVHRAGHVRPDVVHGVLDLGFGRIVVSEIQAPNMLVNLVSSG